MSIIAIDADSLEVGDTLHLAVAIYPAYAVENLRVQVGQPCVGGASFGTAVTSRLECDTVEAKLALTCAGQVWLYAHAALDNGDTVPDSIQIAVGDSTSVPALQWHHDSISAIVNEGQTLYLTLDDSVLYTGHAAVAFAVLGGSPSGDTIRFAGYYEYGAGYGDSGHYRVRIRATDGELADTLALGLTVRNVNQKPLFVGNSPRQTYMVAEGATLRATVRATDADGDGLRYFVDSCSLPRAQSATLIDTAFSWASRLGEVGLYRVVVGVTDGSDTAYAAVQVGVGAVNVPPSLSIAGVSNGQTISVKEGITLSFTVTRHDDNSGDAVRFIAPVLNTPWTDGKGTGSFDTATGAFTYTPGFSTSTRTSATMYDSITFRAVDNGTPPESTTLMVAILVQDSSRALLPVTVISPANAQAEVGLPVIVTWQGGGSPDVETVHYRIWYGATPTIINTAVEADTAHRASLAALQGNRCYSLRVVAIPVAHPQDSVTSGVVTFTTLNHKPGVALTSPVGGKTKTDATTESFSYTGTDTDGDALTYMICLGTSKASLFSTGVKRQQIAATTYAIGNFGQLLVGTGYYWAVVATDAGCAGGAADTSEIDSFTTRNSSPVWNSIPLPADTSYYRLSVRLAAYCTGASGHHNLKFSVVGGPRDSVQKGATDTLRFVADSQQITITAVDSTVPGDVVMSNTSIRAPGFRNGRMKRVQSSGQQFTMGDTASGLYGGSQPLHLVSFTRDFLMDTTKTTELEYNPLMLGATKPSDTLVRVAWGNAALYCNARSKRDGLDTAYIYSVGVTPQLDTSAYGYRLPTEAEWEFACRGGTVSSFYWGESTDTAIISQYELFVFDGSYTANRPVARRRPNPYGFYDMVGMWEEWVNDWAGTYTGNAQVDPLGPVSDSQNRKIMRGNHYRGDLPYCRSGARNMTGMNAANFAFRCVLRARR